MLFCCFWWLLPLVWLLYAFVPCAAWLPGTCGLSCVSSTLSQGNQHNLMTYMKYVLYGTRWYLISQQRASEYTLLGVPTHYIFYEHVESRWSFRHSSPEFPCKRRAFKHVARLIWHNQSSMDISSPIEFEAHITKSSPIKRMYDSSVVKWSFQQWKFINISKRSLQPHKTSRGLEAWIFESRRTNLQHQEKGQRRW